MMIERIKDEIEITVDTFDLIMAATDVLFALWDSSMAKSA